MLAKCCSRCIARWRVQKVQNLDHKLWTLSSCAIQNQDAHLLAHRLEHRSREFKNNRRRQLFLKCASSLWPSGKSAWSSFRSISTERAIAIWANRRQSVLSQMLIDAVWKRFLISSRSGAVARGSKSRFQNIRKRCIKTRWNLPSHLKVAVRNEACMLSVFIHWVWLPARCISGPEVTKSSDKAV